MLCQKPHPEKCAKNPTQKKTGLTGNPKVKSQGQIFQECQGQIPMSNRKMRQNHQMENPKVKSQDQECQECQGQIPRSNISGMCGMSGMFGMSGMCGM